MKDTTKQRWNPLLKTVLFLGIFLAANAGLSTFYRELVLSYTTLYQTDRQFYEQIESVETLCIGDSHAGTSINWTKWPNLFVFWSAGETYAHHYYKLRAILEDPRNRVRRVIASIDPHSLSWRVPAEFREPGYWVKFVDYLELGWRRGETLYFAKEYLRGRFFAYAGDLDMIDEYLQWAIMHGRLGPRDANIYIGYGLRAKSEWFRAPDRAQQAAEVARAHLQDKAVIADSQVAYFLDFLELCKERGLPVLLVKFPLTPEYLDAAQKYMDLDAYYKRIAELIAPYGNVTIYDGQNLYADRPWVFSDADHMEGMAALDFAEHLKRALIDRQLLDPTLLQDTPNVLEKPTE